MYVQAQVSISDDGAGTATISTCDGEEDKLEDRNSSGDVQKRGKVTLTSENETELLHGRVSAIKREAHALYSSGDKKGALAKLRECKTIEHELAVDRALNTARDLAAPPVITPSSPPEKMVTLKKVLSDQQQSSFANTACNQQHIEHQQNRQNLDRQKSRYAATSRELKIEAMKMHRKGNKAKAIALLRQAKSIEDRLSAQVFIFKDLIHVLIRPDNKISSPLITPH